MELHHGSVGDKVSLEKRAESSIKSASRKLGDKAVVGAAASVKGAAVFKRTAGGIVRTGGKVVSTAVTAADRAADNIDNTTVRMVQKSLHIASGAVKLGGKTVKVAAKATGKVIKTSFRLSRAVAQKVRLAKRKDTPKLKVRESKLYKAVNITLATNKYVLKPAAKAAKLGVSAAGTVVDKAARAMGSVDNDTVQFAKKAYDVGYAAGSVAYKTGKASVRTIKRTGNTARKLLTKKGRAGLVKSVKRTVRNIKRTVQNIRKIAQFTVKAAKYIAKIVAKAAKLAAQLVSKLVSLIASTAPWSLIIIAVVILIIIIVNVVIAICGDETENQTAGLVGKDGDYSELYENLEKFEDIFAEAAKDKITDPLKKEISDFCVTVEPPKRILEYDGTVYFPAAGKSSSVNTQIEKYVSTSLSVDRYISFLAALKVLTLRETGDRPLDAFTKADFEKLIGTVDHITCTYGSAFFIATTDVSQGNTCPGANCKRKTIPGCKCASRTNKDGKVTYYCGGHYYCDNDHTKLTVKLKTAEEYYGKSVPEIYGFDEDERLLYESYDYFMKMAFEEMNATDSPHTPRDPTSDTAPDIPAYVEPDLDVSDRDITIAVIIIVTIIFGFLFKRKGEQA